MITKHRSCGGPRAVLVLGLFLSLGACVDAPTRSQPPAAPAPLWTSLTLVTGDRVDVATRDDGRRLLRFQPGPGREQIGFVKVGPADDLSVIPTDALPLLSAGRIDRRLFHIGTLLREGGSAVPLIISYGPGVDVTALAKRGASAARPLPSIRGAALRADAKAAAGLWSELISAAPGKPGAGIERVWLDARVQLLLDQSAAQIGAPQAHARGLTGEGVTVAVLDSGIRLDHPDFAGRIAESKDFTGTAASGADDSGHGTHVAGTVAGSGAASQGRYRGIAPAATLLSGKVCAADGGCQSSAIIAGMEWAAPRARIVNLSLGGSSAECNDSLAQAVTQLSAQHGTLFVVAAGNSGPAAGSVDSPGCADAALSVASVTKQEQLSEFSSWGPRAHDHAVKPDIAAPGSDIVAARAAGTPVGDLAPVDAHYARLSGTSMATPHVAGAAALLAQQHPEWRAAELKAALMTTATPIAGASPFQQGDGRVDLVRATSQQVFATVPSLSVVARWPHQSAIRKVVTYRNDGDAPVTLQLASTNPMVIASAPELTVPARGTAEVAITVDPRGAEDGLSSGVLTATGGAVKVVVAVGVYLEPEMYELDIEAIPRDAKKPETVVATAVELTTRKAEFLIFDGRKTARLLRGRYDLLALALAEGPSYRTVLTELAIDLERDRAITLDSRLGQPIVVTVDHPSAKLALSDIEVASSGTVAGLWGGRIELTPLYVVPTPPVTDRPFRFELRATLESPADTRDDWVRYDLAFVDDHRIPAEPFVVHDAELAVREVRYRDQGAETPADRCNWVDDGVGDMACYLRVQPMPFRAREYFTAGPGFAWEHEMYVGHARKSPDEPPVRELVLGPEWTTYTPGEHRELDWNRAPIGPGLCDKGGLSVEGDDLDVKLPLFSPSELDHCTDSSGFSTSWVGGITGTTTLKRDGVVVASNQEPGFGKFEIPWESATYTLVATADRSFPWSVLATRVESAWTFRAAASIGDRRVPIFVVRASGEVDDHNIAPGGRDYPLTLHVQRLVGAAPLTELALEVSYDDGATWKAASVERSGDTGTAVLQHPAGEGFVSLRSRAADADGNRVEQTVIRAYQIRGKPAPVPEPDRDEESGCGCRVGASGGGGAGGAWLLVLASVLTRARHRRRRWAAPAGEG